MRRLRSTGSGSRIGAAVAALAAVALIAPASASAGSKFLQTVDYPGMTTFNCRTDAIPISPGQNLNLLMGVNSMCPNATKVAGSGPVDPSVFDTNSETEGYVTRFKPSMKEIKPSGLVTPSVWDLHLHHVVWLLSNGGRFASGEEKTIVKFPPGYGAKLEGGEDMFVNYMIHSLNNRAGRSVYLTWQIDWVPETDPVRTDITPTAMRWLDVAGEPQVYPVFDAERGFDTNGDGKFVFPDEAMDPSDPAYEEESSKVSDARRWTITNPGGVTLLFGAGHLHPGGLRMMLRVARDGSDAGTVDGDDPSEVKNLFRSDARYYEPAGAVSWDVAMEATRRSWRVSLKQGDTVFVSSVYDVTRASWYESMGILPLSYTTVDDPKGKDPFDDAAAVREMYEDGGILTHGRLKENIDAKARKDLGLPDPRDLPSAAPVPPSGIDIDGFAFDLGGYFALRDIAKSRMRPPTIDPGDSVLFTNLDAQPGQPQDAQAWHSITSCRAPCNKGSGIGYPLANGPVKFDSGQLGFGTGLSSGVTTGDDEYETPTFTKPGTYTYFCRIHPYMRGSLRVQDE